MIAFDVHPIPKLLPIHINPRRKKVCTWPIMHLCQFLIWRALSSNCASLIGTSIYQMGYRQSSVYVPLVIMRSQPNVITNLVFMWKQKISTKELSITSHHSRCPTFCTKRMLPLSFTIWQWYLFGSNVWWLKLVLPCYPELRTTMSAFGLCVQSVDY